MAAEILRRLHDRRQFGTSNQCPILVQSKRHYGLIDRERVLGGLVWTIEKICLITQRQRDPPSHRVLDLLRDFGVAVGGLRLGQSLTAPEAGDGEDRRYLLIHPIDQCELVASNTI